VTSRPFRLKPFVPHESEVQSTVLALLARHRQVRRAWRVNSGAMKVKGKDGRERYVRFNTCPGHPDVAGYLVDGRALYIECKRPGWTKPTDEREREQAAFIADAIAAGCVAFFARGIDDVLARLGAP
jgi:hypothetical protein